MLYLWEFHGTAKEYLLNAPLWPKLELFERRNTLIPVGEIILPFVQYFLNVIVKLFCVLRGDPGGSSYSRVLKLVVSLAGNNRIVLAESGDQTCR